MLAERPVPMRPRPTRLKRKRGKGVRNHLTAPFVADPGKGVRNHLTAPFVADPEDGTATPARAGRLPTPATRANRTAGRAECFGIPPPPPSVRTADSRARSSREAARWATEPTVVALHPPSPVAPRGCPIANPRLVQLSWPAARCARHSGTPSGNCRPIPPGMT